MKEKAKVLIEKCYSNWGFNTLAVTVGVVMGIARTGFVLVFLGLYLLGAIAYKNILYNKKNA